MKNPSVEDAADLEKIAALKRSEDLAKECLSELRESAMAKRKITSLKGQNKILLSHQATANLKDKTACSLISNSLGETEDGGHVQNLQTFESWSQRTACYDGYEDVIQCIRPRSRLKTLLGSGSFRPKYLANLTIPWNSKRSKTKISAFQAIFFIILLILSQIPLTSAQPTKLSSLGNSPNSRELLEQFDIDDEYISEKRNSKHFEFPELVAYTGRLFQYQIPPEAFSMMKEIKNYQLSEVGQDIAPSWLNLDTDLSGLLQGVPLVTDAGQLYISIEAQGLNSADEKVSSIEILSITITSDSEGQHDPEYSINCSRRSEKASSNLLLSHSMASMSSYTRVALLLTVAQLTSLPQHQIAIRDFDQADSMLWSQLVEWYNPQLLKKTSILTFSSSCLVTSQNTFDDIPANHQEMIQHLYSHCQTGLPLGNGESISCGAWFVQQGSTVATHSNDPLPEMQNDLPEMLHDLPEHSRRKRQANFVIEEIAYSITDDFETTSSLINPSSASQSPIETSAFQQIDSNLQLNGSQMSNRIPHQTFATTDSSNLENAMSGITSKPDLLEESLVSGTSFRQVVSQVSGVLFSSEPDILVPKSSTTPSSSMLPLTTIVPHVLSPSPSPTSNDLLTRVIVMSEPSLTTEQSVTPTPSSVITTPIVEENLEETDANLDDESGMFQIDIVSTDVVFIMSSLTIETSEDVSSAPMFTIPTVIDVLSSEPDPSQSTEFSPSVTAFELSEEIDSTDVLIMTSLVPFTTSSLAVTQSVSLSREDLNSISTSLDSTVEVLTASTNPEPSTTLSVSDTSDMSFSTDVETDFSMSEELFLTPTLELSMDFFTSEGEVFLTPTVDFPIDFSTTQEELLLTPTAEVSVDLTISEEELLLTPTAEFSIDLTTSEEGLFLTPTVEFPTDFTTSEEVFLTPTDEVSVDVITSEEELLLTPTAEFSIDFTTSEEELFLTPTDEFSIAPSSILFSVEPSFLEESTAIAGSSDILLPIDTIAMEDSTSMIDSMSSSEGEFLFTQTPEFFVSPSPISFSGNPSIFDVTTIAADSSDFLIPIDTTIIQGSMTVITPSIIDDLFSESFSFFEPETSAIEISTTEVQESSSLVAVDFSTMIEPSNVELFSSSELDIFDMSSTLEPSILEDSETIDISATDFEIFTETDSVDVNTMLAPFDSSEISEVVTISPSLSSPSLSSALSILVTPSAVLSSSSNGVLVPLPTSELSLSLTVVMPSGIPNTQTSSPDVFIISSIGSSAVASMFSPLDSGATMIITDIVPVTTTTSDVMDDFSTIILGPSISDIFESPDVTDLLESPDFTDVFESINPTDIFETPDLTDVPIFPMTSASVEIQLTSSAVIIDSTSSFDLSETEVDEVVSTDPLDSMFIFTSNPTPTSNILTQTMTIDDDDFTAIMTDLPSSDISVDIQSSEPIDRDILSATSEILLPIMSSVSVDISTMTVLDASPIPMSTDIGIIFSEIEPSFDPMQTSDILGPFETETINIEQSETISVTNVTATSSLLASPSIQISITPTPILPSPFCSEVNCNNGICREDIDECECYLGWEGEFCTNDTNFCDTLPCDPIGTMQCLDGNSTYTCECIPGFSGVNCSVDLDECALNLCQNNGSCEDLPGSGFICSCMPGFTGNLCEVNLCDPSPCQFGGSCVISDEGNPVCVCPPDRNGTNCQFLIDPCNAQPCLNNGSCARISATEFNCSCPPTFQGDRCEIPVDPCDLLESNPCMNNGTCNFNETLEDFECICPPEYAGEVCDVLANTCMEMPCQNGGTCFDSNSCICPYQMTDPEICLAFLRNCSQLLPGEFRCICPESYFGQLCEISGPCISEPCENGGTCQTISATNFSCICPEDFTGSFCDIAFNPCDDEPCQNNGTCQAISHNNFTCTCSVEFTGLLCEIFTGIDPCESNPCENNGTCSMTFLDEFSCTCPIEYTGSFCEVPVDPCDNVPCQNNGSCQMISFEEFLCLCPEDTAGLLCEILRDPCDNSPCLNNGTCITVSFEEFTCMCTEEYTGQLCDVASNPCDGSPCQNNGTCEPASFDEFTCTCSQEYTGLLCEIPINPCHSSPCQNNGSCIMVSFEEFTCMCLQEHTGRFCENPIDPCDNITCQNNGTCQMITFDDFMCTCSEEYSGLLCENPIDPCDSTPCQNNGTCEMISFSEFLCACDDGYTGLTCELPFNPCDSSPCENNGTCETILDDFACSCTADYTGAACEIFVDPCLAEPCHGNATCQRESADNFTCMCSEDFMGDLCEILVDPCRSAPCQNDGNCSRVTFESFTCSCSDVFTGELCEIPFDPCISDPCMNNGTCIAESAEEFLCMCPSEFTGNFCEVTMDPCEPSPCMNNATCNSLSLDFSCECLEGFTGNLCEIPVDPCATAPCENNGTCEVVSFQDFLCACSVNYTGQTCEELIDPCSDFPCLNNGTCMPFSADDFECSCLTDYTGRLCEELINPCDSFPCLNNGTCFPTTSSNYTCSCLGDYTGDMCEDFIDPCDSTPCLNNGTCTRQSPDNFTCSCLEDYTGDFCEFFRDPCLSTPCHNNGTCTRTSPTNYTCSCSPDYTGNTCEEYLDPCNANPCQNNGTCVRITPQNHTCLCSVDYTGPMCKEFLNPCDAYPCLNNGTCTRASADNFTCSCLPDYTDNICQTFIDPCNSDPCFNNATCTRLSPNNSICSCSVDYTGEQCEDFLDPCGSDPCHNNGTCIRSSAEVFNCSCTLDFTGHTCESFIEPCDNQPCQNNGTCTRISHENFSCSCLEGYSGKDCEIELDPCMSEPCLNNGTCNTLSPTQFSCSCVNRFSGTVCETPPPNRPPILLNSVPTLYATEGQSFENNLPDPVFYDPDVEESSSLLLTLLDSATVLPVPNTTWIDITENGTIRGIPTSDQLISQDTVTEYIFILRATDEEGAFADEFVVVQVFPQFPQVLNLVTIFIDQDFLSFNQSLSDKLYLFNRLDSYDGYLGEATSTGTIHLSRYRSGSVSVTYGNLSISNLNCADFREWVQTIFDADQNYTPDFMNALRPFVLFKVPFIEGPCNTSSTNPILPATEGIRTDNSPVLLLSIVVPSVALACIFLILGLACFILYRRKRTERQELEHRYERNMFLKRRPAILEGELALPNRRNYPALMAADRRGDSLDHSGRRRRQQEERQLLIEAIDSDHHQYLQEHSDDESLPSVFGHEDIDGRATPPPEYSPPPIYDYVRFRQTD